MYGHQTDCEIRCQHFVIPWCPVCILLRMSVLSLGGITSQLPLNKFNKSLATHSSLATARYGLKCPLRIDLSGHPS